MSTTAPSYQKIASGVMMRVGTTDVHSYPDRTQREVHPNRRSESITYTIDEDLYGLREVEHGWNCYQYRFTYRHLGRSLSITWRCGIQYGLPKPIDGLASAFADSNSARWEAFGPDWMENYGYDYETDYALAQRVYRKCEKLHDRLVKFFGDDDKLEIWRRIVEERYL